MSTTFCTWSDSVGGFNSNTACLREEVDNLMEMEEKAGS